MMSNDNLIIAGKPYASRLLVGTGKYKDFTETQAAVETSGAEIITIAIRRSNIGQNPNEPNLLDILPPAKYTLLPNTAGCYSADDAVRTLRLARELLDGHSLVKLEVLGDAQSLYPNVVETLAAAKTLVAEGFQVMVYTSDDPIIAKQLEDIGCVAIMPLASLIGSRFTTVPRGECKRFARQSLLIRPTLARPAGVCSSASCRPTDASGE